MDVDEEGKHPKKDVTTTAVDESKNHAVEDSLTPLSRQDQTNGKQKARKRKVSFPEGECLVSKTVEPVDPWANGKRFDFVSFKWVDVVIIRTGRMLIIEEEYFH